MGSQEILKVPVRLHEKILECEEPVVGLDYITELLPESDPEVHLFKYSVVSQCIGNGGK